MRQLAFSSGVWPKVLTVTSTGWAILTKPFILIQDAFYIPFISLYGLPCRIYVFFSFYLLCKQDKLYEGNLEASVKVLKKLSEEWKEHSAKLSPLDPFRATLKSFRQKVSCCCFRILNRCCEFLFYFTNEILFGYIELLIIFGLNFWSFFFFFCPFSL